MHALIEALDTYGIENVWRRYFLAVPLEQKFQWRCAIMIGLLVLLFGDSGVHIMWLTGYVENECKH